MGLVFGVALCVIVVTAVAAVAIYVTDHGAELHERKGR